MTTAIQRFYVQHAKAMSRTQAIIAWLATLASIAVAWSAPEFMGMSILAAVLSLVGGIGLWRASNKNSSGPRTIK